MNDFVHPSSVQTNGLHDEVGRVVVSYRQATTVMLHAAGVVIDRAVLPLVGVNPSMASKVGASRECFATVCPSAAEGSRIMMLALRMD